MKKGNGAHEPLKPITPICRRHRCIFDLTEIGTIDPTTKGRYILVCVDSYTKRAWTKVFPTKESEPIVEFIEDTFGHEGFQEFQSDNGGEFCSQRMKDLFQSWGVKFVHGRPYHPESQGKVERLNGVLKGMIKGMAQDDPNWESYVEKVKIFKYLLIFN